MSVLCPSSCELLESKSSASTIRGFLDNGQYQTASGCTANPGGERQVKRNSRRSKDGHLASTVGYTVLTKAPILFFGMWITSSPSTTVEKTSFPH